MGEGEGGMIWEQHWNMYIIKCETDRQPRLDAWDKCSGLVHWEDPEGWDGEGGGRGDQEGEHMQIHGWFMSVYGKNHYNIVETKRRWYYTNYSREEKNRKHSLFILGGLNNYIFKCR